MADNSTSADYTIQVNFKDGGRPTQWPLVAGSAGSTPIATYTFKAVPLPAPQPVPPAAPAAPPAAGAPAVPPPVRTATGVAIPIDNLATLVFLGLSVSTPPADGKSVLAYNIVAPPAPPAVPPAPPAVPPVPPAPPAPPPVPPPAAAAPTVAGASADERRTAAVAVGTVAAPGPNLLLMPATGDVYVGSAARWFVQAMKPTGNVLFVVNLGDGPVTLDVFMGYSA